MNRMLAWPVCWCMGIGIAASLAAEQGPDDSLEFVRVTVPAERLRDVPLVAALMTRIDLQLPESVRPVVTNLSLIHI